MDKQKSPRLSDDSISTPSKTKFNIQSAKIDGRVFISADDLDEYLRQHIINATVPNGIKNVMRNMRTLVETLKKQALEIEHRTIEKTEQEKTDEVRDSFM